MTEILRKSETCGVRVNYITGDPDDTTIVLILNGSETTLNPEELREVAEEMLRVVYQIEEALE